MDWNFNPSRAYPFFLMDYCWRCFMILAVPLLKDLWCEILTQIVIGAWKLKWHLKRVRRILLFSLWGLIQREISCSPNITPYCPIQPLYNPYIGGICRIHISYSINQGILGCTPLWEIPIESPVYNVGMYGFFFIPNSFQGDYSVYGRLDFPV